MMTIDICTGFVSSCLSGVKSEMGDTGKEEPLLHLCARHVRGKVT